jgi:hypothetical protein
MFFRKKNREEHRYYLLPGQGRGNKMKRKRQFYWACVAGGIVAVIFGVAIWWFSTPHL